MSMGACLGGVPEVADFTVVEEVINDKFCCCEVISRCTRDCFNESSCTVVESR